MVDKNTQNLIMILAVFGIIAYMGMPAEQRAGIFGAADGQITAPTAGPITITGGTPTMEWAVQDVLLKRAVDVSGPAFRVTIDGFQKDYTQSQTIDISLGKDYKVCLMPNASYYAKCITGTTADTVTKVVIPTYALGSATIWINNDPENATTRNSTAAADTISSDDTDTPTVCVQGSTANASYGDGKILFIFDYNSSQMDSISFSVGTLRTDLVPQTYSTDTNIGTAKVAYEYDVFLTNQETVCGMLTADYSTLTTGFVASFIEVDVYDHFIARHSVTDALEGGYARLVDGADTNSATNATAVDWVVARG